MASEPPSLTTSDVPDVLLLLGTDASGKDHLAAILLEMLEQDGLPAEKRGRLFSGRATAAADSTRKTFVDTLQERLFLLCYRWLGPVLPLLVAGLILLDLSRFRPPIGKLVVVGHNGLRALAFHLGKSREAAARFHLPRYLRRSLATMRRRTGVHVIVLDVEDAIRKKRIAQRLATGSEDLFDRYMAADGERSERIEGCLVRLAMEEFGATLIVNNDLAPDELRQALRQSFAVAGDTM